MFRPPVREMCVDVLEDLWVNRKFLLSPPTLIVTNCYVDAEVRGQVQKLVQKWRPEVLVKKIESEPEVKEELDTNMTNGDGGA